MPDEIQDEFEGGLGDDLSRSDLRLAEQALRQDWPIPAPIKLKILQRAIDYIDRDHPDGMGADPRVVIGAMRVIGQFGRLSLAQQALDLAREKAQGPPAKDTLETITEDAERRALERLAERQAD